MFKWLTDPAVFNYVIMALYLAAIIAHSVARNWPAAAYWFFALGITATVTFWYQR